MFKYDLLKYHDGKEIGMNLGQHLVATVLQEIFDLDEASARENAGRATETDGNRLFCALLGAPEGLTAKEIQLLMQDRVYAFLRRAFDLPFTASVGDVGRAMYLLNLSALVKPRLVFGFDAEFSSTRELQQAADRKLRSAFCEGLGVPFDSTNYTLGLAYYGKTKRDITVRRGEEFGSKITPSSIAETLGLPGGATFAVIGEKALDSFCLSVLAAFRLPD